MVLNRVYSKTLSIPNHKSWGAESCRDFSPPIMCRMSCVTCQVSGVRSVINGAYPAEFLNVTVSRSCDRAKFSWLCAKSWDLYAETKNLCILTSFTIFSSWFTRIMQILVWFWHFFLRKNVKTKVLTAQKSLLLECLLPSQVYFRFCNLWRKTHVFRNPEAF